MSSWEVTRCGISMLGRCTQGEGRTRCKKELQISQVLDLKEEEQVR